MNLKDMGKLLSMASSGEMQSFIAKFQAEMDGITADRMALRQAFPKAYLHFNQRMDALESKLDSVLTLLAGQAKTVTIEQPTERTNAGQRDRTDHGNDHGTEPEPARINGTGYGGGNI